MKLIVQFVSGPAPPAVLSVSGSALCSVSGPGVGAQRSPGALCVGPQRSLCRGLALSASGLFVGTGALCQVPALSFDPPPPPLCPSATRPHPTSHPRATTHPPSSDPRATHPAGRVPFFQERTPNLTVWATMTIIAIVAITITTMTIIVTVTITVVEAKR